MRNYLLEVCCGSVDDALQAQYGGANRVELNSNIMYGGLTPSAGAIIDAKKVLDIPVVVMIRPRGGGFCYTEREMAAMLHDTKIAVEQGADGIVFGILKEDGTIDMERNKQILDLCGNADKVFHRAIDVVPDPFRAIDQLVELGFDRVLTAGLNNTAIEGLDMIKKMVQYAGDRIEIMPGGGTPWNVDALLESGCRSVHMAAFTTRYDTSTQHRPFIYYGMSLYPPEDRYDLVDHNVVQNVRAHMNDFNR